MLQVDFGLKVGDFALDVAFDTDRELIALFGYSGSGKSLTLETIAGLRRPDRGFIAIDGKTVFDSRSGVEIPAHRRGVGYLVQDGALFPHLSVAQNIAYGLHRESKAAQKARVAELVELLDLGGFTDRTPTTLSGGQKQRVALARALAPKPKTLLLDEPFAALDRTTREALRKELFKLQDSLGLTIVFVTHDLGEAYSYGGKMAVYDDGKILQMGPGGEIYIHPNSKRVALLTGTSNVIPGVVESRTANGLVVRTRDFSVETDAYPFATGDPVQVCIRPESILLLRKDRRPSPQSRENNVSGTIVDETARGSLHTLLLRVNGRSDSDGTADLQVELPAHVYRVMQVGELKAWTVSLRREAIHLIPGEGSDSIFGGRP